MKATKVAGEQLNATQACAQVGNYVRRAMQLQDHQIYADVNEHGKR